MRFCSANLDSQRIFGIPSLFCSDLPWLCGHRLWGNRQNTQFKAYTQTSDKLYSTSRDSTNAQSHRPFKRGKGSHSRHDKTPGFDHCSPFISNHPMAYMPKACHFKTWKNINLVFSYQYWLLSWPLQKDSASWRLGKTNLNSNPMQETQSLFAWVDEPSFEKTQETRAGSKSLLLLPAANMCHSQHTRLAAGSKQLVKTTREIIT